MANISYEQLALSWSPESKRDHAFNWVAFFVLLIFISIGVGVSSINVPKTKRDSRIVIPDRIAKFILNKPKPKPKKIQKIIPKPPPILRPRAQRKKLSLTKPLTRIEKKARNKAKSSGLLALTQQLSDLIDTHNVDRMLGHRLHVNKSGVKAVSINKDILMTSSSGGQPVVDQNIRGTQTKNSAVLNNHEKLLAQRLLASRGNIGIKSRDKTSRGNNIRGNNVRAEEDVAYVMDKHKSILHALYRRARRRNPGLKGKIVLEITILPSGKVSKVHIVSSDLKDRKLEESLVMRVTQFDFGSRSVETLTVTVPVDFMPS